MTSPVPPEVFEQLLRGTELGDREVAERFAWATDVEYWRRLAPDAHVAAGAPRALGPMPHDTIETAADDLRKDGVCRCPGVLAPQALDLLNRTMDAVTKADWPAAFAFVYDEFWSLARQAAIVELASSTLGRGCSQIPHVWAHLVRPVPGASGWAPHVDGPGGGRLSVWVALTEATVDNGCMYAVARRDTGREMFSDGVTADEMKALLSETRALPAAAGDMLAWTFDIVHWGGRVQRGATTSRRAVSLEFVAADETLQDDERPLVPLDGPLPSLANRLKAIGGGLLLYRRFEPRLFKYERLATRLVEHQ